MQPIQRLDVIKYGVENGKSYRQIAEFLGITRQAVGELCKRHSLRKRDLPTRRRCLVCQTYYEPTAGNQKYCKPECRHLASVDIAKANAKRYYRRRARGLHGTVTMGLFISRIKAGWSPTRAARTPKQTRKSDATITNSRHKPIV